MRIFGKPPISGFIFIPGKLCLFVSIFFFTVRIYWPQHLLWKNQVGDTIAMFLFFIGIIITLGSVLNIGNSLSMGLPGAKTKLITIGLYKYSRNPMYLGLFAIVTASCIFTPHVINFICAIFVIYVHHTIILAEEKFLKNRFQKDWDKYKKEVHRYFSF
ncbi:MAG: hypothetical protein A2275_14215 [Bacteroidetes bacterium RIFOXYA12_FULL_35_11]|nr:MAG: hypothetical protein A2X01_15970 [Bacteroidetes bacterium GWF2_35_48]OFY83520.1 MAG: hypothetical protein A2275_14215 [Bacteroidetes bacterium RIFOXYA12_FULL_35_11]OFY99654.1 MAG: hypothetical protein A2491_09990 [Bacteroidetes bacterium RIFOXYC12_FULL_35_7]HBX50826.1 hypothetical protein [Bacteroidales bacterium]